MNFAPAGTAPFPVAAKVLPPIWGQQGVGTGGGGLCNSRTVTQCRLRVANARLSELLALPLHPFSAASILVSLCTRAFVLLWLTFRCAVNAAYDRK